MRESHWWLIPYCLFVFLGGAFVLFIDEQSGQAAINKFANTQLDEVFKFITSFAEVLIVLPIILLLLWFSYSKFLYVLSAFLVSGLITQLGKRYIFTEMYRPFKYFDYVEGYHWPEGIKLHVYMSFPSGHTTTAFAVFLSLALIAKNKWLKLSLTLLAIIIGFSRVYLSMHYTRDILAGGLIGGLTSILFYYLFFGKQKPWSAKIGSKGLKHIFSR